MPWTEVVRDIIYLSIGTHQIDITCYNVVHCIEIPILGSHLACLSCSNDITSFHDDLLALKKLCLGHLLMHETLLHVLRSEHLQSHVASLQPL